MTKTTSISITPENAGSRLDVFLSEHLGITRSQVQKLMSLEQIFVNGELPQKTGQKVHATDRITLSQAKKTEISLTKKTPTTSALRPSEEKSLYSQINIVAETPEYIVVEKPSGLLTHPTEANELVSLAGFLSEKYPEIKSVGENEVRPGIVHRLDKEASGLMVVARTQAMFEHLKQQFKDRTVNKQYCALVHDQVAKDEGEIHFRLARSKNNDRMAARPNTSHNTDADAEDFVPNDEKDAFTEFWVEKRFVNFTLLEIKIHTGRMHQIRAHFLAYNHPLVGDPLYFQKKRKRAWDEKLGRLFLHSTKLEFTDLQGEKQSFTSALPTTLRNFLETLS